MADNIFDATLDVDNDVKVNNFDWSHANNLTTQIGRITPIFCDMVPAKTSFRVNPRFGLQFMPMVFPIQTRMKARISFYRYPLRALWKDYKDFIGNFREGLEEPYIDFNSESKLKAMASTGSLGDYLGLPSTLVGQYGTFNELASQIYNPRVLGNQFGGTSDFSYLTGLPVENVVDYETFNSHNIDNVLSTAWSIVMSAPGSASSTDPQSIIRYAAASINDAELTSDLRYIVDIVLSEGFEPTSAQLSYFRDYCSAIAVVRGSDDKYILNVLSADFTKDSFGSNVVRLTISCPSDMIQDSPSSFGLYVYFNFFSAIGRRIAGNDTAWDLQPSPLGELCFPSLPSGVYKSAVNVTSSIFGKVNFYYSLVADKPIDVTLSTSPWYNSQSDNNDKQQKILAYSFRAYEGIYNAFFRDNRNNPYYLNGQVQYNQWIPTDAGGADNELYELRYANWEKDFLTTAVQSPQQGNAPLVGITTYAQTVDNGDGTRTELIKTALVDEDGKKYGLSFKSSDEGLEGVEYVELDNGTAVRQARSLYDLATSGISIPDLRMVNCYQKFLELNMRKGYSYKDIVEGRFAVKVRYADLLLPEFFGGVSRDIDVNSITQTVDQNVQGQTNDYDKALGSQAGIAGVRGEANANIECFCDEESIIIGLLVVTPLPVYTQLLPKHFTYRGLMEHYQPEFNLIGFQPIKYNEVCPIQAYNNNPKSLTETFGYNRPWYEYCQKYDVAHGLFRTDLSNFLMHRVFDQKPELAKSFLLVDPEQVTDVFAVTETTDKIYGQIWLDCTCKLPIARVAIPRLD